MSIACPFCDNLLEERVAACPFCHAKFHHLTGGQVLDVGKPDRERAHAFFLAPGTYTLRHSLRVAGKLALVGTGDERARVEGGDEYHLVCVRGQHGTHPHFIARGVVLVPTHEGGHGISVEHGSALLVDFAIEHSRTDKSRTAYGVEVGEQGKVELRQGSVTDFHGEGIRLTKNAALVASKVRVAGSRWNGIEAVDQATVELDGCTIEDNHGCGIHLMYEASLKARVCSVSRNNHEGIEVSNGQAVILECEFLGNKGDPISFSGQSTGEVRDNKCRENGGMGRIVLFESSSPLIGKNTVNGSKGDAVRDMRAGGDDGPLVGPEQAPLFRAEVRQGSPGLGGFLKRLFRWG